MKKVKTKDILNKSIKTLDKSLVGLSKVKYLAINTKHNVENSTDNNNNSINDYSSKKIEMSSRNVFDENLNVITSKGKKTFHNTKNNLIVIKNKTKDIKSKVKIKLSSNKIKSEIKDFNKIFNNYTGLTKKQKIKLRAKKIGKGTAKGINKTFKIVVSSVKAIIFGTKALITLLIAGGWIILVIIVIICLIGLLCSSIFGIFFSSENTGNNITMDEVINDINVELIAKIERIQQTNIYDDYYLESDRAEWKEVLALYTAKVTNGINDNEVITLNNTKALELKKIFWEMHQVTFEMKQEVNEEYFDKELDNNLYIKVSSKTLEQMMMLYRFTPVQRNQVNELLSDEYSLLWSSVIYGTPVGSPDMVQIALSQVGNVGGQPYWSWYGFKNRVGWCAIFVSWVADQAGYIDKKIIPKFASVSTGVNWFKLLDKWYDKDYIPNSGDIIFFDWEQDGKVDHVGIVEKILENKVYTIEGNSGDACKQQKYNINSNVIYGYGVPSY
ncbi:MAG: CHAP domain-containing protein [Bacilli bacterium]|nr:CHAP domain-containing protein [Bacilli bacterium]